MPQNGSKLSNHLVYPLGMTERAGLGRARTSFAFMLLALGCGRVAEDSTPVPPLAGADAIPSVSSAAYPPENPSVTPTSPGMVVPPMMTAPQPDMPPRSTKPYWSLCGEIPARAGMTVDELDGASGDIMTLALSGNGSTLGMYDGRTAMAWHIPANFSDSKTLWYARTDAFQIDVSPDGTKVAGSWDYRHLWDTRNGSEIGSFPVPPGNISQLDVLYTQLRFSPDSTLVGGSDYGKGASIFSAADASPLCRIESGDRWPAIVFSKDSQEVFTSTPERFRLNRKTGSLEPFVALPVWKPQEPFPDAKQLPAFRWVDLSPDGQSLIVSGCVGLRQFGCTTWLYSASDGKKLMELPLRGHNPRFSPNGDVVVADGELFRLGAVGPLTLLDAQASASVFTPEGDVIVGRTGGSLAKYCNYELIR